MGDVIGLMLMGVGAMLIWIGVHGREGSMAEMLGQFFGKVQANEKGGGGA
ncbi:hypothetical protein SAZ_11545 [Streptomyces noursei ZPM]|uniref:Uncharacterized protein n=1 Tax=Streptomyces noursei TaxID=1971 RepID=A0A401QY72_STRNR|nr:hypothetical protein SAZ_11545 [Streptomyces noursei ZPM]GCB90317.1 hypothetical protein SALB_03021 [Streptomyces noursei]